MQAETMSRMGMMTGRGIDEHQRRQIEQNIAFYASRGAESIDRRIAELDGEWDLERALERNVSAAAVLGVLMGLTVGRRFFLLPLVAGSFLLMHALRGWAPPVAMLRGMGYRTRAEIDYERYGLKALRGDFASIPKVGEACRAEAHQAVEAEMKK